MFPKHELVKIWGTSPQILQDFSHEFKQYEVYMMQDQMRETAAWLIYLPQSNIAVPPTVCSPPKALQRETWMTPQKRYDKTIQELGRFIPPYSSLGVAPPSAPPPCGHGWSLGPLLLDLEIHRRAKWCVTLSQPCSSQRDSSAVYILKPGAINHQLGRLGYLTSFEKTYRFHRFHMEKHMLE